jgi:cytochrome P450
MPTHTTPPGPRGIGLRSLRCIQRDPLAFFAGLPRRYGPVVRVRLGPITLTSISDPALVTRVLVEDAAGYKKGMALDRARVVLGDGLLASDGDLHRRQLRLIGPALSPRRIRDYEATIQAIVDQFSAQWRDGEAVDIAAEMSRLTLQIVVATLFGSRLDVAEAERVSGALTGVMEHFDWMVTHPLGTLRLRIPTSRVRGIKAARSSLRAVVDRLIDTRSRGSRGSTDLLSDLVAARDDAGGMGRALLGDEVTTLMLAGHETTANWLTFTWLALSDHPDVAGRLREELDSVLGTRPVTVSDRDRLPFTNAVLQETLRLFPPAWGMGRRARSDRRLGDSSVPEGSLVSVCPYVLHRSPALWDDADAFDPGRWLDGRTDGMPRGAFIPFSDGPRRCIGEHFARGEALLIVATLARQWDVRRRSTEPVGLDPKVTLRPAGAQLATTLRIAPQDERASVVRVFEAPTGARFQQPEQAGDREDERDQPVADPVVGPDGRVGELVCEHDAGGADQEHPGQLDGENDHRRAPGHCGGVAEGDGGHQVERRGQSREQVREGCVPELRRDLDD